MSFTVLDNENVIDNMNFNTVFEKIVFMILIRFEKSGKAFPSLKSISKLAIISKPTVIKALKGLEEQGKIIKYQEKTFGDYDNNIYIINSDYLHASSKGNLPPSKGDLPRVVKGVYNEVVKEVDTTNTNKTNTNKQCLEQAEKLWSLYPRKRGKANAIKKIAKLIKEYGYEQLVRCIERYIKEIKEKNTALQYVKHGDTFFNSGYMDYLDNNYQNYNEAACTLDKPAINTGCRRVIGEG